MSVSSSRRSRGSKSKRQRGASSSGSLVSSGKAAAGGFEEDFEFVDALAAVTEISVDGGHVDDVKGNEEVDGVVIDEEMTEMSELNAVRRRVEAEMRRLATEAKSGRAVRSQLAALKIELDADRKQLRATQKQCRNLAASLEKRLAETDALHIGVAKELSALRRERKEVASQLSFAKTELESLSEERVLAAESRRRLDAAVSDLVEAGAVRSQGSAAKLAAEALLADCSSLADGCKQLAAERRALSGVLEESRREGEWLRTTHSALSKELAHCRRVGMFCCKECGEVVARECDVESRCFQVGQGSFTEQKRGYLFTTALTKALGKRKTETFTTGKYTIAWVSCDQCSHTLGWKYLDADSAANRVKVGKFCLARHSLTSPKDRAADAEEVADSVPLPLSDAALTAMP